MKWDKLIRKPIGSGEITNFVFKIDAFHQYRRRFYCISDDMHDNVATTKRIVLPKTRLNLNFIRFYQNVKFDIK